MGKTVARASFSVKSKAKKKKPEGPPLRVPNLEKRSREYLTVSEVNQLIKAAKNLGRHGERKPTSPGYLPARAEGRRGH